MKFLLEFQECKDQTKQRMSDIAVAFNVTAKDINENIIQQQAVRLTIFAKKSRKKKIYGGPSKTITENSVNKGFEKEQCLHIAVQIVKGICTSSLCPYLTLFQQKEKPTVPVAM